jgi:putative ABC transport system permease protein
MKIPFKYNVRNLFVRRGATLLTIASIAFVVLVYTGVLALAGGVRSTLAVSGDPTCVLVLRKGAHGETESFFEREKAPLLATLPGVARGAQGEALASGQLMLVQILKRENGSETNVALRGVSPEMFSIRPSVRIIEGRNFVPGTEEIILGKRLAQGFRDLKLGGQVALGRLSFKVVGIFDAGGTSFDSEIWGAVQDFAAAFRRQGYSSVLLKTRSPEEARQLVAEIEREQQLRLSAKPEPDYFAEQTQRSSLQFVVLGNFLAVLMAFGACFAAANTMYAQVAARSHEIGTLRALGFRRRTILSVFLIEAAILGVLAGGVGALLALPLNGLTASTVSTFNFSELEFSLRTTPAVLLGGIGLALLTSLAGSLPAAFSASRRQVADLLGDR